MNQEEMFANVCNEQICNERKEHSSKMSVLIEQEEINLFVMLKPKVNQTQSGKWLVELNEYVVGKGDTLMKAIYDFNKQFHKNCEPNV